MSKIQFLAKRSVFQILALAARPYQVDKTSEKFMKTQCDINFSFNFTQIEQKTEVFGLGAHIGLVQEYSMDIPVLKFTRSLFGP